MPVAFFTRDRVVHPIGERPRRRFYTAEAGNYTMEVTMPAHVERFPKVVKDEQTGKYVETEVEEVVDPGRSWYVDPEALKEGKPNAVVEDVSGLPPEDVRALAAAEAGEPYLREAGRVFGLASNEEASTTALALPRPEDKAARAAWDRATSMKTYGRNVPEDVLEYIDPEHRYHEENVVEEVESAIDAGMTPVYRGGAKEKGGARVPMSGSIKEVHPERVELGYMGQGTPVSSKAYKANAYAVRDLVRAQAKDPLSIPDPMSGAMVMTPKKAEEEYGVALQWEKKGHEYRVGGRKFRNKESARDYAKAEKVPEDHIETRQIGEWEVDWQRTAELRKAIAPKDIKVTKTGVKAGAQTLSPEQWEDFQRHQAEGGAPKLAGGVYEFTPKELNDYLTMPKGQREGERPPYVNKRGMVMEY